MSERPTQSNYHIPVLLEETLEALRITEGDTYVDATFGGGGHAKPILNRMTAKGRLFGFDQDEQAAANAPPDSRLTFVHANFRYLRHFMLYYGIAEVDGILADLGVSSHHFDEASRGFSHRFDALLDMRMNQRQSVSATDVVNNYDAARLQQIFSQYGEVRNAKTLSRRLVEKRHSAPLRTIGDLVSVAEPLVRGDRNRYLSQVFQAIRIEVNDEMGALGELLTQGTELLKKGGRFVVLTYHSVEDRVVKNFFKRGNIEGRIVQDEYGRMIRMLIEVNKKPIVASEEERTKNPRSLSAKLRIAHKP